MAHYRRFAPIAALLLVVALLAQGQPRALAAGGTTEFPLGQRMIFFSADGMRPDYVDKYARSMPTFSRLKREGIRGDNGMLSQAPPNTGAGWNTMMTGAWPGVTGSQNNSFHKVGDTILTRSRPYDYAQIQAETLAEVAEKSGKKVAMLEWVGSLPTPRIRGPVVEFNNQYSGRGVIASYDIPGVNQELARELGVINNKVTLTDAAGWTGAPESFSPAKQTELLVTTSVPSGTQSLRDEARYSIYIYDSTNDGKTNYDRIAIPTDESRNLGTQQRVIIGPQQWAEIKLQLPQATAPGNRIAGFYIKTVDLAPDLSRFRLFFSNVQRGRARWIEREPGFNLEDYIAVNFPTYTAADFGPIEVGLVDDPTYVEQGLMWSNYASAVSNYVLKEYNPDVVFAGVPTTDEFSHQYMALGTPGTPVSGKGNPRDVSRYDGFIRMAYEEADKTLARLISLMPRNTAVFSGADHGFAPHWKGINANQVLADAGLLTFDSSGRVNPDAKAIAYIAGGAANIYINLAGRERAIPVPNANPAANYPQVAQADYEKVRQQIIDAFANLRDTDGARPIDRIFRKEETRNLMTEGVVQHLMHPTRTGDVVVFALPPYQYDAAAAGTKLSDVPFYGQHGYMPDMVDLKRNINMHAAFYAWGPNINRGVVKGMTVVDMAPSAAFYLGIQAPEQAEGNIRLDLFRMSQSLKHVAASTVSDFHGQIEPINSTVDTITVSTGGLAFIKTMVREDEARDRGGPRMLLAGGDSIGATPLISAFKEDFPTLEAMNAAGFTADGIGNHNYDRGQEHMSRVAAAARFPFLSANTVFADSGRQVPWARPSIMMTLNGVKVGLIGITNPEAFTLVNPSGVQNLKLLDPVAAVRAEAPKLRQQGAQVLMVVIHSGAEEYTSSTDPYYVRGKPVGPAISLASSLNPSEIDVIVADHTDVKVREVVNGILIVENRSKGVTFSDIDLYVDPRGGVVYKTAKVRPAWNLGVTPDPAVNAVVQKYAEEIKPFLAQIVGESAILITRSRGGESPMGNLVADAIRTRYGTQIALVNSGGLRADIDPGPISYGEVFNVLPFGNQSVTLKLTGRQVLQALENGVSDVSGSAGRFAQVSGVYFTYDPARPVGQRVVGAFLDKERTQAIDPNATYSLATIDFLLGGGDNYTMLAQGTEKATRDILVNDLITYIGANRPTNPQVEGRIQRFTP